MTLMFQACVMGLCLTVLLALYRLARGPTMADRMFAFDLVAVSGVGLIAVLSALRSTTFYLELILVYSLLGFLGTVALTLLLTRGEGDGGGGGADGSEEDDR
jgi:multisubunit Na+/H+ antiporter MnhF subunit